MCRTQKLTNFKAILNSFRDDSFSSSYSSASFSCIFAFASFNYFKPYNAGRSRALVPFGLIEMKIKNYHNLLVLNLETDYVV